MERYEVVDDLKVGLKAYEYGYYDIAFNYLKKQAECENVQAQFILGEMFRKGEGVDKNIPESIRWIKKSAEHGNSQAQYKIGMLFRTGNGVQQNDFEALRWITRSARNGHLESQQILARMHEKGKCAPLDMNKALRWYMICAANGGYTEGNLCSIYCTGNGVPVDVTRAFMWDHIGKLRRENGVYASIFSIYDREITAHQIDIAKEMAMKWLNARKIDYCHHN